MPYCPSLYEYVTCFGIAFTASKVSTIFFFLLLLFVRCQLASINLLFFAKIERLANLATSFLLLYSVYIVC